MPQNASQKRAASERKSAFLTSSDVPLAPTYGPAAPKAEPTQAPQHACGKEILSAASFMHTSPECEAEMPGAYPYTRGVHPNMYRSRLWTMRQYAGFGDAKSSNERYRYLLARGQTGLSVAFDLPTQMGHDSDSSIAAGEVGRVGVAIDSIEDMEILLAGIDLQKVSISMTINATASILLCMVLAVAQDRGLSGQDLRGTIQNDILKEYIARGTYIYPPRPSMRLVTDTFAFCAEQIPKWNTISISGYHIREAGSTATQELALTLANGIAYVDAAQKAGLDLDVFAPRLAFFFNVHNHFFEEVAKFRAARRLWAQIMRDRFGAKNPKSWKLRFHAQTAGSTLTAQQPDNNVVRVAVQALAAVLGGTQSLHTNGKDEALSLPTESSAQLALRTQQILAEETGVADVADPLGGSHYIEALTDRLCQDAHTIIEQMDTAGGMITAIEAQLPQKMIQDAAYQSQLSIDDGAHKVVGVNIHREEAQALGQSAPQEDTKHAAAQREEAQKQALARLRQKRCAQSHAKALATLKQACQNQNASLMPHILAAVKARATVGEIAHTMGEIFGKHQG